MRACGYISAFLVLICLQACSSSPEGKNSYQEPRYYEETFYIERKGAYRLGNFLVEGRAKKSILESAALLDGKVQREVKNFSLLHPAPLSLPVITYRKLKIINSFLAFYSRIWSDDN